MSKFTDALRTHLNMSNDYAFFGDHVYITHHSREGRGFGARWAVHKKGSRLGRAWYEHDSKWFSHGGGGWNKLVALAEAQEWVRERYGVKEWVRSPFGGMGDATFVQERVASLRAAVASLTCAPLRYQRGPDGHVLDLGCAWDDGSPACAGGPFRHGAPALAVYMAWTPIKRKPYEAQSTRKSATLCASCAAAFAAKHGLTVRGA